MDNPDELVKEISDILYWNYKDIWDGYLNDEIDMFKGIKGTDEADRICDLIVRLLNWGEGVSASVFNEKTRSVAIMTECEARDLSFVDWLSWVVRFLRNGQG